MFSRKDKTRSNAIEQSYITCSNLGYFNRMDSSCQKCPDMQIMLTRTDVLTYLRTNAGENGQEHAWKSRKADEFCKI
jgi:hypothetical protein